MSSIIVLIAGAVGGVNELTAQRIYHAMINHGISCESVNMINSWDKSDKFAQNYKKRQNLGELPRVIIVRNHPVMDKTAKMDACRSFWCDNEVPPTLSVCLRPTVDYYTDRWYTKDDEKRFIANHLIPTYESMPIICFGAKHHRSYKIKDELSLLCAAGGAVKAIHEILKGGE